MNKHIATALGAAAVLLLGPASAAPGEAASAGYELESVADGIFDHGQEDHGQDDEGQDDHDHDGDGRPDHDPEDHDDEDGKEKPTEDD